MSHHSDRLPVRTEFALSCSCRLHQRGFGLVELMVGISIGLIVIAGASLMLIQQISEHRRLVLETQVQQDLRATADLMLRELRRAGSWATPQRGIWAPSPAGVADPSANPYTAIDPSTAQQSNRVEYSYSRATDRSSSTAAPAAANAEDNVMTSSTERFGFRLQDGIMQFRLGDRWQPLTDTNTLRITAFNVRLNLQSLALGTFCENPCPTASTTCPPQLLVRSFDITMIGHATHDARVIRSVNLSSRVRNDQVTGSCAS
jgi:prepilin peptidase dependent protein B